MSQLISATELSDSLADVVVLDVRWALTAGRSPDADPVGLPDYAAGHVPGAHFLDLDTVFAAPAGEGGRHPLPEPETVQAAVRACGVDADRSLVLYDGRDSYAAARAWWVLRWLGVEQVRVLDGGFAAWERAGLPVSQEIPVPGQGSVVLVPGSMPTVDAPGARVWPGEGLLLDARAPERYAGEVEPIDPVAGHIPGAVNSPTSQWLAADGTFRTDLAKHWDEIIAGSSSGSSSDTADHVAVYCGSGVTAAHHVLALAELGIDATLYPGSWSEWVRDPARPVATGPQPG